MAAVIEAGIVLEPGEARKARAVDGVGQYSPGRSLNDAKRTFFRAAGRSTVGDILAVVGGEPPIERYGSVGGELVDIDQRAVVALQSFAHIKKRLVLAGIAARVEVVFAPHLRRAHDPDVEELRESRVDLIAAGKGIEHGAGVSKFFVDEAPRVRIVGIFEIAIGIDDLVALNRVFHGSDLSLRRARGRRRVSGDRDCRHANEEKKEDSQQAQTSEHRHLTFGVDLCCGRNIQK